MGKIVATYDFVGELHEEGSSFSTKIKLDGVTMPQMLTAAADFYATAMGKFIAESIEKGMPREKCTAVAIHVLELAMSTYVTRSKEEEEAQ